MAYVGRSARRRAGFGDYEGDSGDIALPPVPDPVYIPPTIYSAPAMTPPPASPIGDFFSSVLKAAVSVKTAQAQAQTKTASRPIAANASPGFVRPVYQTAIARPILGTSNTAIYIGIGTVAVIGLLILMRR